MADPLDPRVADLIHAGKIRVALFLPQYVLDSVSGEIQGRGTGIMAIEITRILASRMGIAAQTLGYPTPAAVVESLETGASDLAFMGIEPSRAATLDFSPAIFEFDYTYLVPAGSTLRNAADVDRPGRRVAVVRNHASTLKLSRVVMHAELVGAELPDAAFESLCARHVDALAFPRDVLLDYSARLPGSRVLADSYGVNRVGIAIRKGQANRIAYIGEFIEEAKTSGLTQRAIESGRLRGFRICEGP